MDISSTKLIAIPQLEAFFSAHPSLALAFSGGTDSALLLYAAKAADCQVQPYFVKSPFQPGFELEDAKALCAQLGTELKLIDLDVLSRPAISSNPPDRCYHCKKAIFTALFAAAEADGFKELMDGTNASDISDDRPGMRVLRELGVLSPLRQWGITKADVRRLSAERGLFTASKPSYACLATRIPSGTTISRELLETIEQAENLLFSQGYSNFRVRLRPWGALLQFDEVQHPLALSELSSLESLLSPFFKEIKLDPIPRSMEL